ncbi:hypothetical protein PR048_028188 [Dryococelus australis]|uniref:Uncharacterized protein n=1 Tax=Dryococelus australis TaxID=614101 RepID=A0ABQ9GIJ2_9NEOP|nr:hypothetical protein PR048_028188 [Dryococelus australis]
MNRRDIQHLDLHPAVPDLKRQSVLFLHRAPGAKDSYRTTNPRQFFTTLLLPCRKATRPVLYTGQAPVPLTFMIATQFFFTLCFLCVLIAAILVLVFFLCFGPDQKYFILLIKVIAGLLLFAVIWGRGGVMVRLYALQLGKLGLIPTGVTRGFSHVELCHTMLKVGRFSRGSPVSLALAFRHCSIFASLHPHRLSIPLKDSVFKDILVHKYDSLCVCVKRNLRLSLRFEQYIGVVLMWLAIVLGFSGGIAVIIFASLGNGKGWMPEQENNYLGWAFGLGVVGVVMAFISGILFVVEFNVQNKKIKYLKESQTRFEMEHDWLTLDDPITWRYVDLLLAWSRLETLLLAWRGLAGALGALRL